MKKTFQGSCRRPSCLTRFSIIRLLLISRAEISPYEVGWQEARNHQMSCMPFSLPCSEKPIECHAYLAIY